MTGRKTASNAEAVNISPSTRDWIDRNAARAADSGSRRWKRRSTPWRILIVDDDPDQLMLFELLLKREGFEVAAVQDPSEALSFIKESLVDAAVIDLRMPKVDGLSFIKSIRQASPSGSTLPIVLFSASPSEVEMDAIEAGADVYCPKSASPKALLTQLRALLT